jgi:hypothetical protein
VHGLADFITTTFGFRFSVHTTATTPAMRSKLARPGRFAIVKPVDPDGPAVADVVADWKKTPGAVGNPHHANDRQDRLSSDRRCNN